jgi:steroid 5-alpha reductase family enzyme
MSDQSSKTRGGVWCSLAYLMAGGAALGVGLALGDRHPLLVAGAADLAATLVVFAFAVAFNNSSFYDAYWSLGPLALAAYYGRGLSLADPAAPRQLCLLALVALWGLRLTYNWWRGWRGLDHEDWRYVDIRNATGRLYWPASLLGIHLVPTAVVFAGCLPLYVALGRGTAPLGPLDGVALAVTAVAIWIEARADRQLRDFVSADPPEGAILDRGLWALCRHPNYLGEILFWWGLYCFAIAARPEAWWTGSGGFAVCVLFSVISLPLIERRMLRRRPGYAEHCERVPLLFPRPPRRERLERR